ncbi:MAG: Asp-tRNA(Asn)/Glu-tRNA(Gln) amidotransferase subunit GatC [Candidatus Paceibacterota bacterium]
MTKEEILHLSSLARIKLTNEEVATLKTDIPNILDYVSAVNTIVADTAITKDIGVLHNVFREDIITNEAETYTEELLKEMPAKKGRYLKVKKILNPDS